MSKSKMLVVLIFATCIAFLAVAYAQDSDVVQDTLGTAGDIAMPSVQYVRFGLWVAIGNAIGVPLGQAKAAEKQS